MKILIIILSLSATLAWGNTCIPSSDSCDAYLCMEQKYSCGYKGYPLRFGYRLCKNFLKIRTKSETVNKWLVETRYCLQEKFTNNPDYSCKNMFQGSINDHVSCYNETGYCDLSRREKNFVKRQILKEFLVAPVYIIKNAKMFFQKACRN